MVARYEWKAFFSRGWLFRVKHRILAVSKYSRQALKTCISVGAGRSILQNGKKKCGYRWMLRDMTGFV